MTESSLGIDRIDQRILSALQADGRLSNLRLAEAVALSPTAVLARVQRLTREGYILGYEARLNPLKLGAGMMVFVEVLLDKGADINAKDMDSNSTALQVAASWGRTEVVQLLLASPPGRR